MSVPDFLSNNPNFKNFMKAQTSGAVDIEKMQNDWQHAGELSGIAAKPTPDLTDEVVRQRRAAEMTRLMLGVGRSSTFTQGGMGDLRLGTKSLVGGS